MDTLRDTDEGRARPSVWPVYVAAVVVGVVSLPYLLALPPPIIPIGLFGFVTIWGLSWLRPWGWWCAVVWTSIFTVGYLLSVRICLAASASDVPLEELGILGEILTTATWVAILVFVEPLNGFGEAVFFVFLGPLGLITIALLTWVLATRRQLFFPPKQEGEE